MGNVGLMEWLLDRMEKCFDEPDAGLWEFRGRRQKHLYTYLFHWAGSLAAARIARHLKLIHVEERAVVLVNQATDIIESCWDEGRGAFTQAVGSKELDASSLQLLTMHYLDPASERAKRHVEAHRSELADAAGKMRRYGHHDDFGRTESSFIICSFWHAEALACLGRVDEAIAVVEGVLSRSGPLGLLSEDLSSDNLMAGNYPQTYSHVGLLNALFRISGKSDRPVFM